MFGRLPAHGFYCRHVQGLRLRHVELRAAAAEARPALVCDDVKDLDVDSLRSTPSAGTQPVVKLIQTQGAFLRSCAAPAGTKTFLEVQGDKTERVLLLNSDLTAAAQATELGIGVPAAAVRQAGNVTKG
jgi:hypothetical protein